jgi:hypothetical protein
MHKLALTLLGSIFLAACSQPPAPVQAPAPTPRHKAAEPEAPRPTLITIEYGNSTSKASLQVDIANNDVYLDMSNVRPRIDTVKAPAAPALQPMMMPQAQGYAPQPQPPQNQTIRTVNIDSSVREDNRKIVDASVRPASGDSDGATLKVTSSIRKAQDAFYKGSYEEAQILTRKSIEARPTPEAHALAGSIAWTLKDFPLARFHWKQALTLDPEFPGVSEMLIRLPQETR